MTCAGRFVLKKYLVDFVNTLKCDNKKLAQLAMLLFHNLFNASNPNKDLSSYLNKRVTLLAIDLLESDDRCTKEAAVGFIVNMLRCDVLHETRMEIREIINNDIQQSCVEEIMKRHEFVSSLMGHILDEQPTCRHIKRCYGHPINPRDDYVALQDEAVETVSLQ